MNRTSTPRCDQCAIEVELFKDLVDTARCPHSRPHRRIRIHRR